MSVISIESSEEETLKRLNPKDLDLSGLEALSFDYVVKWPLSLIISRKKIVHYQLLFRFLFYTKHIERIVNNVWLTSTQLTKVNSRVKSPAGQPNEKFRNHKTSSFLKSE